MKDEPFDRAFCGEQVAPETVNAAHCTECGMDRRIERSESGNSLVFCKHYSRTGRVCENTGKLVKSTATLKRLTHRGTFEIICPWCAYPIQPDCGPEEWDGAQVCAECEKPFNCEYYAEVTYNTERIDPAAYKLREQQRREAWIAEQQRQLDKRKKS